MSALLGSTAPEPGNVRTLVEYTLQAELEVGVNDAARFEELVAEFLGKGGFSRLLPTYDVKLVLGLRTPEPFRFVGNADANIKSLLRKDNRPGGNSDVFRYINVFRLPDIDDLDLARIMICCADDPLYTAINGLVARERQHLRTRVKFRHAVAVPARGTQYYHVERSFLLKNLGGYLFGLGACFPALEQEGWKNLGLHQAVTGELNVLSEYWEMPPKSSASDVLDVLRTAHPKLYRVLVEPYPARADLGETLVDASYASSQRRPAPPPSKSPAAA